MTDICNLVVSDGTSNSSLLFLVALSINSGHRLWLIEGNCTRVEIFVPRHYVLESRKSTGKYLLVVVDFVAAVGKRYFISY